MKSAGLGRLTAPAIMIMGGSGFTAATVAGLVGYIIAIAIKSPVWPFALIIGVQVIAFGAGMAIYGERGAR